MMKPGDEVSNYQGRGLHGQTVEQLGALIVNGAYQPGAPLLSEQLERDLDVSKTVVREALKVLAAKGLVESRQKRGTLVRLRTSWNLLDPDVMRWQASDDKPDFDFLENLAEVRAIIEPAAARLAATRRTDEDLEDLVAALDAMVEAGDDGDALVRADVRFHRAALEAAHNELLSRMEVVLSAGLQVRGRFVHRGRHRANPVPIHRALYEAILDKDADRAGATVDSLLAQAAKDLAAASKDAARATQA